MSTNGDWRDAITAKTKAEKAAVQAAGSYAEAQRLIQQYRKEGIPSTKGTAQDQQSQDTQPDETKQDRSTGNPLDTKPTQPVDQQELAESGPGISRPQYGTAEGGIPGGSETIQGGQPKESASEPQQPIDQQQPTDNTGNGSRPPDANTTQNGQQESTGQNSTTSDAQQESGESQQTGGQSQDYPDFMKATNTREFLKQASPKTREIWRKMGGDRSAAIQLLQKRKLQKARTTPAERIEPEGGDLPGGFSKKQLEDFTTPEAPKSARPSKRFPELYNYQAGTVGKDVPLPGRNITEVKAGVPVDTYKFDPSDPQDVARWLSKRDERQQSQKRVQQRRQAEKRLRTGNIKTPQAFTDQKVLQQPVDIKATSRKKFQQQLRSEFAERFTEATVADLSFKPSDITLQKTEKGGYQPQLTKDARSEIQAYRKQGFRKNLKETVATTISGRWAGIDVGPEDIGIQQTEKGLQPVLQRSGERELLEFQREGKAALAAKRFDAQTPTTDINAEDIQLGGPQGPALADDVRNLIQKRRRERAKEKAVKSFDKQTPIDITKEDIQRKGDTFTLTKDAQADIQQERREQAAESIRSAALDADVPIPTKEGAGTKAVTDQIKTQVEAEDIKLTGSGPMLDTDTQRQIAAAKLGVDESNVVKTKNGFTLSEDIREKRARQSAAAKLGVDESNVVKTEEGFTVSKEIQEKRARKRLNKRYGLGLSKGEVTVENNQVSIVGSGVVDIAKEKAQLDPALVKAAQKIDDQTDIKVGALDLNRDGDNITLEENTRDKIQANQREKATEKLMQRLQKQTGADLEKGDINVTTVKTDDGEVRYQAELTESGRQEFAGEQVPGNDLPVVGGVLEGGGETAAEIEQTLGDVGEGISSRLPDVKVPNIPTPSAKQLTAAGAAGVATPEPITTGTGTVLLGTVALGGLAAAGARRAGLGQGPPQAQAGVTQEQPEIPVPTDGTTRDITEITIPTGGDFLPTEEQPTTGEALPQQDLPVAPPAQEQSEVGIPEQTQTDPTTLTTQQLIQGQVGGERTVIDDIFAPEDLPQPREQPPSVRKRQRRDDLFAPSRQFPTGGSAVVGSGELAQTTNTLSEFNAEVTEPSLGTETGTGSLDPIVWGASDQQPQTEPEIDEQQTQGPDVDVGPREDTGPETGTQPQTEPQTRVGTQPRVDGALGQQPRTQQDLGQGLDNITQAQLAQPSQPAFPDVLAQPEGPGYPEGYGVGEQTTGRRRRRPRIPDINLDANGDEDDDPLFGGVIERYSIPFLDPLRGNGEKNGNGQ